MKHRQATNGRLLLAAAVAGLMLAAAGNAAAEDAVATVVNCSGTVWVDRASGRVKAQVGMRLNSADTMVTGGDGRAWIVFRSGALNQLKPGSRLAFGQKPAQKSGRLASILAALGVFGDPDREGKLSRVGGGVRPAAERTFFVLDPRRSYLLADAPKLRWTAQPGAARYRIKITSIVGRVFEGQVDKPELDLAAQKVALARGQLYFTTVAALAPKGDTLAQDETAFTVASAKTQQEMQRLADELAHEVAPSFGQDAFGLQMLLAELYVRKTFYSDALRVLEQMHAQRPEVPWVRERIAAIRELTGLPPASDKLPGGRS